MKRALLLPLSLILLVSMACSLGQSIQNNSMAPAATQTLIVQTEIPTLAELPTDALAPTLPPDQPAATEPAPTEASAPSEAAPTTASAPAPTEASSPTSAPQASPTVPGKHSPTATPTIPTTGDYFSENFSGQISDFKRWVTVGDPKKFFGNLVDGALKFELPMMDTYAYASRNGYSYSDVYVEAQGSLLTGTNSSMAVVCRVSDAGWDELRVSTRGLYAGTYEVYRYDADLAAKHKVPYVNLLGADRVNSLDIKPGTAKNIIGLSCVGQELRIFINGVEQTKHNRKLEDKTLTSGGVGVGVIGYYSSASTVQFTSLMTRKPE